MRSLLCTSCGGPLPAPGAAGLATCAFCGTSSQGAGGTVVVAERAQGSALVACHSFPHEFAACEAAYSAGIAARLEPEPALRQATEAFGQICDPTTLANVVIGMARWFQGQHGVDPGANPTALPRLVASYLGGLAALVHDGEHLLSVPMLVAGPNGPIDFQLSVTMGRLAELAEQGASAPKKRRGLLGRFFR